MKLTAGEGRGVVETREVHGGVNDVAAGEDVGMVADNLAITITTTMTVVFTGRHCN